MNEYDDELEADQITDEDLNGAMPLIAQLVQANYNNYAATTQVLMDGYEKRARVAEATLAAIRTRVEHLMDQDYMPNPRLVVDALYPSEAFISAFINKKG